MVSLVGDVAEQLVHVNRVSGDFACKSEHCKGIGHVGQEMVWEGTQNGASIVDVSDGHTDHLKLVALGAQVIEELPNVTVLGALHVNECLVEVGFGMFTLG